eukprot:4250385-Amphidinium_carterae.1
MKTPINITRNHLIYMRYVSIVEAMRFLITLYTSDRNLFATVMIPTGHCRNKLAYGGFNCLKHI